MTQLVSKVDVRFIPIFVCSLFGGLTAFYLGVPMPFLLGGIVGAASFVLWYERDGKQLPKISRWMRLIFMSIVGAMIGSRFTPDLLPLLPQFWVSALALVPFILIAHGGNYAIMRGLGRYKKLDAYFAALPGGIIDSVALAEEAGADVRIVAAQHFIRIILVVTSVPLLFFIIDGSAVGSSAGESMATTDYDVVDVLQVVSIGLVGLLLGRAIKLPVAHMLGPLLLALSLSVSGLVQIDLPPWLPHVAQYFIGTALGGQFSGMSRKLLVRGLGMGLLSGAYMLLLAGAFAIFTIQYVPADFGSMFISFAAGGLAEMSLIALSLNFNPIVVALHHLLRILLTIYCGNLLSRRVFKLVPMNKAG